MKILIKKLLRNKYLIAVLVFLFFLFLIDDNSIVMSFRLRNQLKELQTQKEFYESEIQKDSINTQLLKNDKRAIETFAREKYYMKKESEDVFIVKTPH